MKVLVNTENMSYEEWLEWRKLGLGGSDAGVIAGMNPYKSPYILYLEKIGEWQDGEQSEPAYWGNKLEEVVANEFSNRAGLEVRERHELLQHDTYPFMLANLDREVINENGEVGILECKTASEYKKQEWDGDNIPSSYYLQVQHYLAVTGYSFAYIAVLIGGNKFHHKEIERDDEIINYLIQIEKEFWEHHVQQNIPPALDGMSDTTEYLNNKFDPIEDSIELSEKALQRLTELEETNESIKLLKEQKAEFENNIKNELGEYSFGTYNGEIVVTWKANKNGKRQFKPKKLEGVLNG